MKLRGKIRIHVKKDKKRGLVWKQAVIYLRRDDLRKIEHLDGKEVTIAIGNYPNEELFNLLVSLFIKAFRDPKLKKHLIKYPETKEIIRLL